MPNWRQASVLVWVSKTGVEAWSVVKAMPNWTWQAVKRMPRRLYDYSVNVGNDYRLVAIETAIEAKQRRWRTVAVIGGVSLLVYAHHTNPTMDDYLNDLRRHRLQACQIGLPILNEESATMLIDRTAMVNQRRCKHIDLVFASLIVRLNYGQGTDIYASQCRPIRPSVFEWYKTIDDVGLFGMWLLLNRRMIDADINDNEWPKAHAGAAQISS